MSEQMMSRHIYDVTITVRIEADRASDARAHARMAISEQATRDWDNANEDDGDPFIIDIIPTPESMLVTVNS